MGANGEALSQRATGLPATTRITRQAAKATTTTSTAQPVGISKAIKGRPTTMAALNKAGKVNGLQLMLYRVEKGEREERENGEESGESSRSKEITVDLTNNNNQ